MDRPRLLDLFCGAGGAAMGYHEAGFEVVGVDIVPQPRYPFEFHQADALTFPLEGFDAIHASPPCQAHTTLRALHDCEYPNLIPQTRAGLLSAGVPFVIENVPGAPLIRPIVLCGVSFGLRVYRHRLFESNVGLPTLPHMRHPGRANSHRRPKGYMNPNTGKSYPMGDYITVAGHNFEMVTGLAAMGIDWMKARRELAQAIPPAYTRFIGEHLMAHLRAECAA